MTGKLKQMLLWFLLAAGLPTAGVHASPGVAIRARADSVYVLEGTDLTGVAGLDITLRYDAATLSRPRVALGELVSGALIVVNDTTAGMLRLGIVRVASINGSGAIAIITFDRTAGGTGAGILSLISTAISNAGHSITLASYVLNAPAAAGGGTTAAGTTSAAADIGAGPAPAAPLPGTGTAPRPAFPGAALLTAPSPGAVAADVPAQETGESKPGQDGMGGITPAEPDNRAANSTPPAKTGGPQLQKILLYQGVLDRFKEFKGKKTPQSLMALFTAGGATGTQDPPVVLSDGKAKVRIMVELSSLNGNNRIELDGVTLLSLTNADKDRWTMELLPNAQSYEATVSIPTNSQLFILPLTVAPPLDIPIGRSAGRLTESDFKLFLKERGSAKAPRYDLNRDGVRDFVDDYIFTANYLIQHRSKDVMKKSK